jgi:hypothetical protein
VLSNKLSRVVNIILFIFIQDLQEITVVIMSTSTDHKRKGEAITFTQEDKDLIKKVKTTTVFGVEFEERYKVKFLVYS